MKAAFLTDCRRVRKNSNPSMLGALRMTLGNHGLQALFAYRLGKHLIELKRQGKGWGQRFIGWPLYYLARTYVRVALDIRLELSADIGPGLYIGHFGNILVERCVIGKHCSIAQSTHLQADDNGDGPMIGNRVWIGAHASIKGKFVIEDGATISAAAHVKRDIPGGALCMGNPARVVMMEYNNSEIL